MTLNINFTNISYGIEKAVCIAHLEENTVTPYAVVRNVDFETRTWSHAIAYCRTYEDAKRTFWEYMGN